MEKRWDLGNEVELDGGMKLIYEGKAPLGEETSGVVFPCKLKLGGEDEHKVIDAVVKCEKRGWNGADGYELCKWKMIPHHENLVKFYGGKVLEPGESKHFGALFVLERMDCNLKQFILEYGASSEKCSIGNVVSILQQIVNGLMHLRENGFIHMNLKPENVLVSGGSGRGALVKITNFCVTETLRDSKYSITTTLQGSFQYMAPEVFLEQWYQMNSSHSQGSTEHADVYSFGKLMCTLFDSQVPHFISEKPHFDIHEISVGDFVEKKAYCQAPKELCNLTEKCLQFDLEYEKGSRQHGRPSLDELLSALEKIKRIYPPAGTVETKVHRDPNYLEWDFGKRVDLEGGMQLVYEGEEALGGGSYGVVFPCKLHLGEEDEHKVIDAVVKCEKKECSKDGYEIHKWNKIPHHENLVKFYGGKVLNPGESKHFGALFVLERMDCNLQQLISKYKAPSEKYTLEVVVSILLQIVQGLMHLQKNGFMHMDLKPENILLSRASGAEIRVKITDLGVSKELEDGKKSVKATYRGTSAYMAPELYWAVWIKDCSHRITAHADVYSFGRLMCTLFDPEVPHFISGDSDFDDQEIKVGDIGENTASCRAPTELCDLTEKCLQFTPEYVKDSRNHGRPSLEELWSALKNIKRTYASVNIVETKVTRVPDYLGWDLEKEVDLDEGMHLICDGEEALVGGFYGVIFLCKLRLGGKDNDRVIDAVVKCEKKECKAKDEYEIHKRKEIPPHENLVKFYGGKVLDPDESKLFGALMVFEKMDCNLQQLIFENGAFVQTATYDDVIKILVQIVHGLIHIHNNGFVHLDVKPENIYISKSPEGNFLVKISDFSQSERLNRGNSSVTATYRGTVPYMAPELMLVPRFMSNRNKITEHADVYSFGNLMLNLLNRQHPVLTSQAQGSDGREIDVGGFQPHRVFCQAPLEMCDLIEKCLSYRGSKLIQSRKHDRPSFKEVLEALKKMEKREWMSQTMKTEEDQHISAAIKSSAGEVEEVIPSSQEEEMGLFQAARRGSFKMVKDLLDGGESVNLQDKNLSTPLMKAAVHGHIKVVEELLSRGAEKNVMDRRGASALALAAGNGRIEVVNALLKGEAIIHLTASKVGPSALHHACRNGHTETAKLLLQAGADVNMMDTKFECSALHCACANGHTETAKYLLDEAGANVHLVDSKFGKTAFDLACLTGHIETAEYLTTAGANVDDENSALELTALSIARLKGLTGLREFLLKKGFDVNMLESNFGCSFLAHSSDDT